jgi:hypothetical protein
MNANEDFDAMELSLKSWWSNTYNRPLKDPLLDSYTVYELMYEYFDKIERKNATYKAIEQENDKIEDSKLDETLSWIEQEEEKEAEKMAAQQAKEVKEEQPPKIDDEQWMVQQLKSQYGDEFGEDINLNLDE